MNFYNILSSNFQKAKNELYYYESFDSAEEFGLPRYAVLREDMIRPMYQAFSDASANITERTNELLMLYDRLIEDPELINFISGDLSTPTFNQTIDVMLKYCEKNDEGKNIQNDYYTVYKFEKYNVYDDYQNYVNKIKDEIDKYYNKTHITESNKKKAALKIYKMGRILKQKQDRLFEMRPGTLKDSFEKAYVKNYLSHQVSFSTVLAASNVRYYGCSYTEAIDILSSQQLLSYSDRYGNKNGFTMEYDIPGYVPVRRPDEIEIPILNYAHLDSISSLAGCLFVLQASSHEIETNPGDALKMPSIDLQQNPEKLVCIVTTTENYDNIASLCMARGLEEKVVTIDTYAKTIMEQQRTFNEEQQFEYTEGLVI